MRSSFKLCAGIGYLFFLTIGIADGQGLKVEETDMIEIASSRPILASATELDPVESLRDELPPPGNQLAPDHYGFKNCVNSCVGWTVGYGLLSTLRPEWKDNPRNPIYVYHWAILQYGLFSDEGCEFGHAFQAVTNHGSCGMADFKNPLVWPTGSYIDIEKCNETKIPLNVNRIARQNLITEVKLLLAKRKVVPCAFNIPTNFGVDEAFDRVAVEGREELIWRRVKGNHRTLRHAMLVVGYNDHVGENGAFEVMNSYGPKFGNNGFIWIDYKFFQDPGKNPNVNTDNPCCVFACDWERTHDLDGPDEIAALAADVAQGNVEAWTRLVDRSGEANFTLPPEGVNGVSTGSTIEVSRTIGAGALKLSDKISAIKSSKVNRATGRRTIVTSGNTEIGGIGAGDKMQVTDVKEIILKDGSGKTEVWVRGKLAK